MLKISIMLLNASKMGDFRRQIMHFRKTFFDKNVLNVRVTNLNSARLN